jgi:hypothetical protein
MDRLPDPKPGTNASPAMAVRGALLAYARPDVVTDEKRTYELHVDGEPFTIAVGNGSAELHAGPSSTPPHLAVYAKAADLVRLRHGSLDRGRAEKRGSLRYDPPGRGRVNEFARVFALE